MIEVNILNIVGVAILGNFIAHWFDPIQGIKRRVLKFLSFIPFINYLEEALYCSKCSSFWLALILFHDLLLAAVISLVGYLINHLIDRINVWYE